VKFLRPIFVALLLIVPAALRAQAAVEVQVTPAQLRLRVGQSERLFLSAYDAQGNLLASPTFSFILSREGIVRVGPDGTVTAEAAGTVQVEVRSGTGISTVAVTVSAPAAPVPPPAQPQRPKPKPEPEPVLPEGAYLVPNPDTLSLLRLEAAPVSMGLLTPSGAGLGQVVVSWLSSAPDVATVDSAGLVRGQQVGTARIVANGPGGLTASVFVVVREDSLALVPGQMVLAVGATDSVGVTVPAQGGRRVTYGLAWRSGNPAVASVTSEGRVSGVGRGEATVTMLGYGQQRTTRVTVHPPVARLRIAPAPGTPIFLTLGNSAPILLQATAADSSPVGEVSYQWDVADTTVAVFDGSGSRIVARGVGRTTLTLSVYGFEPTVWEVDVSAGSLAFERTRRRLPPGGRDSLAVNLLDDAGTVIGPAPNLDFSTSRPEVVAVEGQGAITAGAVGAATITARTSWGASATTDIFVTEPLLVAVRRGGGVDLVQLDSAGVRSLVPVVADGNENLDGAWSPDGTQIAFAATVDGNTDIYVADADGQGVRRVTDAPEADSEPAWSPDGGTIAFTSLRSGTAQLWAMNPDGTGLRQLTDGPGASSSAVFRPDGRLIAFISTRDGNPDLFEMGNEGADPRPITRTPEPESHPVYTAAGDLVVVVDRSGRTDILRVRAGDGRRTMLQSSTGRIDALAVAADGSAVIYALTAPGATPTAPPVHSLLLKRVAPDAPPVTIPLDGEVRSLSLQGIR